MELINLENKGKLGILITIFILVIIGLSLLSSLADNIYLNTNTRDIVNETITIAANTGQTANDDLTTVTYFGNTTVDYTSAINTGVNFTTAGVITVANSSNPLFNISDNDYRISYNYEPDEYINNGTARTMLSLIVLFFAIGIVALGVLLVRKTGLF